ncbi:MAG: hypothetical protein V3V57_02325 [Spirochaetia bacterium]
MSALQPTQCVESWFALIRIECKIFVRAKVWRKNVEQDSANVGEMEHMFR